MGKLTKELRERLDRLSTTNVSDALDALGLKGSTYGVNKMYEGCEKIIGEAVTMKVVAAGLTKSTTHMGVNAIEVAKEGDVIVIDNGGRIDVNCWGGVLSTGAKYKGVSGVVFIPQERLEDVVAKAETLLEKEEAMCRDIKSGMSMMEVDKKYNYENMLK